MSDSKSETSSQLIPGEPLFLPPQQLLADLVDGARAAIAAYSPEQVLETARREYPLGDPKTLDEAVERCMIAAAQGRLAAEAAAPKLTKYDELALVKAAAKRERKAARR